MNRRTFLHLGLGMAALSAPGQTQARPPLRLTDLPDNTGDFGLARSLLEEGDYVAKIQGRLPPDLQGTLFRNGPGRFDRGAYRKQCILDGDGMIQAFRFAGDGKVRYSNRFIRTSKWKEEEASGSFEYATWTTNAPGGMLFNLGANVANQAGVSVWQRNGKLYAFDEYAKAHTLNPATLETLEEMSPGDVPATFAAHPKRDPVTGQWILFGLQMGPSTTLHLTILDGQDRLMQYRPFTLDKNYYVHDFFVSRNYIIVPLQPAIISVLGILAGTASVVDSMQWQPELGTTLLVFDRKNIAAEPIRLQADPVWMWHSFNAFETSDGEIVADFVGYDAPDHFLGENPAFFAIMRGIHLPFKNEGKIRRHRLNLASRKVRTEILHHGGHEFPQLFSEESMKEHQSGFAVIGNQPGYFPDGIARIDFKSGKRQEFHFGSGFYTGEPVIAPGRSGRKHWVLTLVYDSKMDRSFLGIFDAASIAVGPVCRIWLRHHSPLSFHGDFAPI
ncbi:MAG: carotenoid oxygenase family protein [Leptospiraceae bacterium]|nr:carotenoid oxygenase family protein [Leptospiraceae bacterium]